jgi:hypothetical protein
LTLQMPGASLQPTKPVLYQLPPEEVIKVTN